MIAVMSAAGVTSKAGFQTGDVVGQAGGGAHLGAGALLDLDVGALRGGGVERRARHGDVERHAVVVGGDREPVGADLVRGVAVGDDAVAPTITASIAAARQQRRRGALGQHGHRDAGVAASSHAVSRAPCSSGRVSQAKTSTGSPAAAFA